MIDHSALRPIPRLLALALVTTVLAAGCSSSGSTGTASTTALETTTTTTPAKALLDAACAGTLRVEDAGTVTNPDIKEASGIAASRVNAGRWWVHNDSGDSARYFLIDITGVTRATVIVEGATAHDWEDIAVGPPAADSGAASVYLADIGDNASQRGDIQVYRMPEPIVALDAVGATIPTTADRLTFTYPDGAHDAETLIVDPDTGDLVIVTKDWSLSGHSEVFRAPAGLAPGSTTVLEKVADLKLPAGTLVTGGDVTSDGSVVALRTYGSVNLYPRVPGQPLWSAFSAAPCTGPLPIERQGEAIGFGANGGAYATISEGADPVLHLTHS